MTTAAAKNNYNHTAWFYEPLAAVYSLGRIRASKLHELQYMKPGDRVLYAGVGGGEDAVRAAQKGVNVTCIDLAPNMIAKVESKMQRAQVKAEMIVGDLLQHDRSGQYDMVCANYFLNVFTPDVMATMLDHLVTLVKPGGYLLVADFAVPRGNPLFRALHIGYYRIANVLYWAISGNGLHPIYDYSKILPAHGLTLETIDRHALFPGGPTYFQTAISRRPG